MRGYEAMNMIPKGQVKGIEKTDIVAKREICCSNFWSSRITRSDLYRAFVLCKFLQHNPIEFVVRQALQQSQQSLMMIIQQITNC